MSHHPWGQTVEIFGIESPTNGHCCEEHTICGAVLTGDCVVRFRKVQFIVNEKEESAIVAFWVSDGVGQCCISTVTPCEALEETQRSACSDHGGLHRRL